MIEEILKWPNQVTESDLAKLDIDKIVVNQDVKTNPPLLNQFRIVGYITTALKDLNTEDYRLGYNNNRDVLINIWIDVLTNIRNGAETNSDTISAGNLIYENNPYKFVIQYTGLSEISLEGHKKINETEELKTDFGRLLETGKAIQFTHQATKLGKKSSMTSASLNSISKQKEESLDEIIKTTKRLISEAKTEINTAAVIKGWNSYYNERIEDLKKIINGEHPRGLDGEHPRGLDGKHSRGLRDIRTIWFWLLISALVFYAILALIILNGGIHINNTRLLGIDAQTANNIQGFSKFFIGLTIYGLLGGIFIGYSHANKQLKVHQNILEQYRHRAIVAKTIEEIITAVAKTKSNELDTDESPSKINDEQLKQLVDIAAKAMFEGKATGYLSTNESTGIISELLNIKNN